MNRPKTQGIHCFGTSPPKQNVAKATVLWRGKRSPNLELTEVKTETVEKARKRKETTKGP